MGNIIQASRDFKTEERMRHHLQALLRKITAEVFAAENGGSQRLVDDLFVRKQRLIEKARAWGLT